jgi:integrase
MPSLKRHKTNYPGVFYVEGVSAATGKPDRVFYIRYRRNGKLIEEKAGWSAKDDMTAARASGLRALRIEGKQPSNKQFRNEKLAQQAAIANRWTIIRLWDEYRSNRDMNKGLRTDQGRFRNFLSERFGSLEPKDLIKIELERYKAQLLKSKSPQTVKSIFALLKRIINFGINNGLCQPPPFKISLPIVKNNKTEDLTAEQLSNLLKAINNCPNIHARNIMLLALCTAMRRGEMFKLRWEHIDFEKGFISLVDPKGGTDEKIPLNESARRVLNDNPRTESPYVFFGRSGKQRTDIHKTLCAIREAAGLPKSFRPLHGLRHFFASALASTGQVDMYTLQKLLTHKSPVMTQRYAHLRDEALKKASGIAGLLISEAMAEIENAAQPGKDSEPSEA